jgi:hypothetical protein
LEASQRLEQWRSANRPRSPLPEWVWSEATKLAQHYGVNATARTLRLDYMQLKKHLPVSPQPKPARFVELVTTAVPSSSRCLIEMESKQGKLRVELSNAPDWEELLHAWRHA